MTIKYSGNDDFDGVMGVLDSKIYVNSKTKEGYMRVVNKMAPVIHKYAVKFLSYNDIEDVKQDIIVHILESIPKYSPSKGTKLSTFLEMRIYRMLVNIVRNDNRMSKNATSLNIMACSIECSECNARFVVQVASGEEVSCNICGSSISTTNRRHTIAIRPSLFSDNKLKNKIDLTGITISLEANIPDDGSSTHSRMNMEDLVMFEADMSKAMLDEDQDVINIINLIYEQDHSIDSAADELGIPGSSANFKIKKLSRKKIIRDIFGR